MKDKKVIAEIALNLGFSKVGFCALEENSKASLRFEEWLGKGFAGEMKYLERGLEKRKNPRLILPQAQSLIALAWDYSTLHFDKRSSPYISRYAWGKDYHEILGDKLLKLEKKLKELFPNEHFKSYVDTGPVMEKEVAAQSGLGWVGKHTNLIDENKGSYFFLASLLTSLELEPDSPINDRCGTCSRCIDICPTQAIIAP